MNRMKVMATMALAAGVLGAHAQTTTNGTPTDSHVLQGNFEAGGSPVFLTSNANADRCGTGGGGGSQRVNQPIFSFDLPTIPAGETVNAATFSFKMAGAAISGAPLEFDMVVCLMNYSSVDEFSGADFIEGTAPVNSPLGSGIVIGQFSAADVSNDETVDVSLTGAALSQLAALYGPAGTPSQPKLWFRCSTSTTIDVTNGDNDNDRFNFDDAGHTGPNISNLELNWGIPPADIYYVATTPAPWTVGAAWSDGLPAHSNESYFVTNNVALQTPSTTATFPGSSLELVGSQTVELMVSGSDVITFPLLELGNDTLRAGVVDAGEAKIDGTINTFNNSILAGATNNTRDLRVQALITGVSSLELSAPTKTIYIDNTANTFDGTWVVSGGTAEFAAPGALGSSSIQVQSNGTLRILGDWDGLSSGETLTIADSVSTLVELGTNVWTVGSLMIGSSNVEAGQTYDIAALNALGDAVFSGTGTIQVGAPFVPPQEPDANGLVARWTMNEGTGTSTADESVNGYNGVIDGATWVTNGSGNRATYLQFDGADDRVDPSLSFPSISKADSSSWAFWAKADSAIGNNGIIVGNRKDGAGTDISPPAPRNFLKITTAAKFNFHQGTDKSITFDNPFADMEWHHFAFSRSGDMVNIYVDGVDINGGVAYTIPALAEDASGLPNLPFYMGGEPGQSAPEHFGGGIDDVNIYDYALNAGEIVYIMNDDGVAGPVEPPRMEMERVGGNLVITWDSAGDFKLQTRAQLPIGGWVDYPGGDTSPVTVPATNDVEFLRLIEQ